MADVYHHFPNGNMGIREPLVDMFLRETVQNPQQPCELWAMTNQPEFINDIQLRSHQYPMIIPLINHQYAMNIAIIAHFLMAQ